MNIFNIRLLIITLLSILTISCTQNPHWQPIYDQYVQNMLQENDNHGGEINKLFSKIDNEFVATNKYATKEEIKLISIIQRHLKNAIILAKQDILNYPLENSFTKAYKRLDLLKSRKITFAQAVQLKMYDDNQTQMAMNNAYQQVSAQQQAQWERQTQNIGKGLGKTQHQIQLQQEYQRRNRQTKTSCYKTGDQINCSSFEF